MSCGWPMMIGMLVVWVLVVGGIVAGVFFLVRALRDRGTRERGQRSMSAVAILEERYARGEIDEQEFLARRDTLRGER